MSASALKAARRAASELGWPAPERMPAPLFGVTRFRLRPSQMSECSVVVADAGGAPHLSILDETTSVIVPLQPAWPGGVASWEALGAVLRAALVGSPPFKLAWGEQGVALTRNGERAARLHWGAMLAGDDALPSVRSAAGERTGSEVTLATRDARVVVVGLGSVGSYLAEHLLRSGVGSFILIDDDVVEPHNLSRTTYDAVDIGKPKALALEARLARIDPNVEVQPLVSRFDTLGADQLRRIFQSAHLIVAATDDPRTQLLINRCAWRSERPSLYVGLFEGAVAGEIGYVLPGMTRCFSCFVGSRRAAATPTKRTIDYGLDGRLQGEVAVACDIHHVSGAAVKIALAILSALATDGEGRLARFVLHAASLERSYVHLAMEPRWAGFADRFDGTPGQYAWQSIWMGAAPDATCPVCGAQPDQADPFEDVTAPLDAAAIRAQLAAD
jgi:molybdopterin/thiamine biosynthesis adenylyltransferase